MTALDTAEALAASPPLASLSGAEGGRAPFVPRWHDPEELAKVLTRVRRSRAHRTRLPVAAFLLPRVPRWTLCSDTLKADRPSSARRPMARAWRAQWLSLNSRARVNALTVDMDHDRWEPELRALAAQGVPAPSFLVRNPQSGHAQATWVLAIGADRENPAQMRLLDGARLRLTRALDGDPNFKNWLIRNPLHPDHEVLSFSGEAVELSALLGPLIEWSDARDFVLGPRPGPRDEAQHKGPAPRIRAVPASLAEALGAKGARLWEVGRHRVYRSRASDPAHVRAILQGVADELRSPIKARALDGMARRIAAWMAAQPWADGRAAGDARDIDHGAMTREAEERGQREAWVRTPRDVKLPLAAERTNALRAGKTAAAIADALARLAKGGTEISQASLAAAAGLSRRTVVAAWTRPIAAICQQCAARSYPFSPRASGGPPAPPPQGGNSESLWRAVEAANQGIRRRAAEAAVIRAYDEQAERMSRRGGRPELVPPRGPDASPDVRAAHERAMAARRVAQRRERDRAERAEARARVARRREDFAAWAAAGDVPAFRAFVAAEVARWEAAEDRIDPVDRAALRTHYERRGAYLKRLHIDWRAAQEVARRANRLARFRRPADDVDRRARQLAREAQAEEERAREAARARLAMPTECPPIFAPGMPAFLAGRIRLPSH